ncbi:MAG: hypothetical protein LBU77_03195 [Clostridiales bacterium]|jgi:CotS family spore coat protein|nr:hypothetical protein [Clostridiales bacterium]
MEEINIQAVHHFGLKPKSIVKHKLYHIVNTNAGVKVLKKVAPDSEKARQSLLFQHYIKENLCRLGYPFLDRFHASAQNEPFVALDKALYSLTDHLPFRESNFSNAAEFKKAVTSTATVHALAKKIEPLPYAGDGAEPPPTSVAAFYQSTAEKLGALKKSVSKYKQLSDFDVLFCKHYAYYKACLDQWYELIRQSDFDNRNRTSREKSDLCHNLLKEEYILLNRNEVYITNFSECAYGCSLKDFAQLIKRHFKAAPDCPAAVGEIIETYQKHNPLTKKELEMLYAILLLPDKFIKICTQYYAKKRTWIPGTFKSRIEQTIETKDAYRVYVDRIYEEFLK